MNVPRSLSAALGIGCLVLGVLAAMSNPTMAATMALGHTLVIAGAIIISAVLISSAISGQDRKEYSRARVGPPPQA